MYPKIINDYKLIGSESVPSAGWGGQGYPAAKKELYEIFFGGLDACSHLGFNPKVYWIAKDISKCWILYQGVLDVHRNSENDLLSQKTILWNASAQYKARKIPPTRPPPPNTSFYFGGC